MARKATMVSLYQRGVWPRKFCQKALAVFMAFPLSVFCPRSRAGAGPPSWEVFPLRRVVWWSCQLWASLICFHTHGIVKSRVAGD